MIQYYYIEIIEQILNEHDFSYNEIINANGDTETMNCIAKLVNESSNLLILK